MKKLLVLLLTMLLVAVTLPIGTFTVSAGGGEDFYAEYKDGYYYSINDGCATIVLVDDTLSGKIAIPSAFDEYKVTSIASSAFYYSTNLTDITIPNTVTNIGDFAFKSCTSLITITIPDSVTSIGNYAFEDCTNLTTITVAANNSFYSSINGVLFNKDKTTLIRYPEGKTTLSYVIPDSVTDIYNEAFSFCSNITNMNIPNNITNIGDFAFENCINLSSITIDNNNTNIGENAFYNTAYYNNIENWKNDVLYISNHIIEVRDTISGDCEIKTGTRTIPACAFEDCTNITSITIPDSVTSIGRSAFEGCINLSNITISNSAISIGNNAFYNTAYYNNATNWENDVLYISNCIIEAQNTISGACEIKAGTKTISSSAFEGCTSLTSIIIPDSVTNIGNYAFYECYNLISVNLPDGITRISEGLFAFCNNLKKVKIPDSVTTIEDSAFGGCKALEKIDIPKGVTYIGSFSFGACENLKELILPDSLKTIGTLAFAQSPSFEKIIIPNGVTNIEEGAFYECVELKSIIIPKTVTVIGYYALYGCNNLTIYTFKNSTAYSYAKDNSIPYAIIGDFTDDEEVTADDIVGLKKAILFDSGKANADLNCDGIINILDFICMEKSFIV